MNPNRITDINWSDFETAYGSAKKIPAYLQDLFSGDMDLAIEATGWLWASLCHQHAYISSAALPSYDFLLAKLNDANDLLKVEILDIILGFAVCTHAEYYKTNKLAPQEWEIELKRKLLGDFDKFKALSLSQNEDISYFAGEIVWCLSI